MYLIILFLIVQMQSDQVISSIAPQNEIHQMSPPQTISPPIVTMPVQHSIVRTPEHPVNLGKWTPYNNDNQNVKFGTLAGSPVSVYKKIYYIETKYTTKSSCCFIK